jgi:hypothetical protein
MSQLSQMTNCQRCRRLAAHACLAAVGRAGGRAAGGQAGLCVPQSKAGATVGEPPTSSSESLLPDCRR